MSNAAVNIEVILRLRSVLLREGKGLCAAFLCIHGGNKAARYQREG